MTNDSAGANSDAEIPEAAIAKEAKVANTDSNTSPLYNSLFGGGLSNLNLRLVNFSEVSLKEKVGHGTYGVVYKAIWRDRYVAVKEFGPKTEKKAIEIEVKQLSRVQHPNIIGLYGITSNQAYVHLIMEFVEGGSLHDFLHGNAKPHYSTAHAISWARQCAEGVAYLHAMKPKPLIHRDLKPLNLLLTNKGRQLKICDFGTVIDKSTNMTTNKGSVAWMAPEVIEGSKYTEKCDIFSWGIVLWEVLSRQKPFNDVDNAFSIMWKIHKGERPPLILNCPEPIQNLMISCWETEPEMRPSMQYIVDIMNDLASAFPGADKPLEYEFTNQQIVCSNTNTTNGNNYVLDFSNFTSMNSNNTYISHSTQQLSNTSASALTITNSEQLQNNTNSDTDIENRFSTTISNASSEYKEPNDYIRNRMIQMGSIPMTPLSINIDNVSSIPNTKTSLGKYCRNFNPQNAWDLDNIDCISSWGNSDGEVRSRITTEQNKTTSMAKYKLSTIEEKDNEESEQNHQDNSLNEQYQPDDNDNNNVNNDDVDVNDGNHGNDENDDDDDDVDNDVDDNEQSWHEMLDSELQPEPPLDDNIESKDIYYEHKRLAKEYLRIDTNIYFAKDFKEQFLAQLTPAERQEKEELLKKINEKEELLELYNNLKQQLESLELEQDINSESEMMDDVDDKILTDNNWMVIPTTQNT